MIDHYLYRLAMALLLGATAAARCDARAAEPRTSAAVVAADEAWGKAEAVGDAAFVDDLLLPEYRSIGSAGVITTKRQIVDKTKARGNSPAYAAQIATWRKEHPADPQVVLSGDTAVLTWMPTASNGALVRSCDIFVYRSGHWHALYSQHTSL